MAFSTNMQNVNEELGESEQAGGVPYDDGKCVCKPQTVRDRVRNEANELDENLRKLTQFLDTKEFTALPYLQQSLLNQQHAAMIEYSKIIHIRLITIAD